MRSYWGDLVIDPTGKYVLTSSYDYANGRLIILRAEDANKLEQYDWIDECDYAGDIVFSPDGAQAYAGFGGNPGYKPYSKGRIIIVDMNTFDYYKYGLDGPRSLAFSNCQKLYAYAKINHNWGTRIGIVELIPNCPTDPLGSLMIKKFYCATNQYYDVNVHPLVSSRESIFFKQGSDCMKETAPEYATWVDWNKPCCWCCRKQCRGDINCASFFGKPVTLCDLDIFRDAFNKPDESLRQHPLLICADLNHEPFFGKRVTLSDLEIFKQYFNKPVELVPCCDLDEDCILTPEDKYNYWTD